jgi:tetratricopeptide (TPR) repeat protein
MVILGIVILISSITYVFNKRNSNRLVFFSICWFFITLLPQSNLYPINAYMAEHWLYLPSIGFFLIVGNGLSFLYRRRDTRILTICLITGLLTFYSYLTIRQNSYWREPIAFYKRTLKYVPDSPRIYYSLGGIYHDMGKKEEAIALYKKAIEINPTYAKAYNNLGLVYKDIGKGKEAIDLFKKAVAINPNHAYAYNNLGGIYHDMGKKEEAITLYKKAIAINLNSAEAYYNLGNIYRDMGKKEEAITLYKKAIAINPDFAEVYNNLAIVYYNDKQYDLAVEHCDLAIKFGYKVDPEFLKLLKPHRK